VELDEVIASQAHIVRMWSHRRSASAAELAVDRQTIGIVRRDARNLTSPSAANHPQSVRRSAEIVHP